MGICARIRLFFTPRVTTNLFETDMEIGQKLKIKSAMDAIQSSNRSNVSAKVIHFLGWRKCPEGKDKLISAIARLNLDSETTTKVLNIAYNLTHGLSNGEGYAKVLEAICKLPKDQLNYFDKASSLFKDTMSVEDRVKLIESVAEGDPKDVELKYLNIFNNTSKLLSANEAGTFHVLRALSQIPDWKRDSIIDIGKELFSDEMNNEDRAKVIMAMEHVQKKFPGHLRAAKCLFNKTMSAKDMLQLLEAVGKITYDDTDDDENIFQQTHSLTNHLKTGEEKKKILDALTGITIFKRKGEKYDNKTLTRNETVKKVETMVTAEMTAEDIIKKLKENTSIAMLKTDVFGQEKELDTMIGYRYVGKEKVKHAKDERYDPSRDWIRVG